MGDRGPVPGVYRPGQVKIPRRRTNLVGTIRPKRPGCTLALVVATWAGIVGAFVALVAAFGTQAP